MYLQRGDKVTWWHQPSSRAGLSNGQQFALPVDGVVVKIHPRLITIAVRDRSGKRVTRCVSPASLSPREDV